MFPKLGFNNPVIKLNIVDLPTPFGPNIPHISPSLTVKVILSKICLLPKDKDMFFSSILGLSFLNFVI